MMPTSCRSAGKLPHSSPVTGSMSSDKQAERRCAVRAGAGTVRAPPRVRPTAASAFTYQNAQIVKAVTGVPKSSGMAIAEEPVALLELALHGRERLQEARVVAAHDAEFRQEHGRGVDLVAAEAARERLRRWFQAACRMCSRICVARPPQASARSRQSQFGAAMRCSRSQPAQHIAAENVCVRSMPRNSHGPESGCAYNSAARSPKCSRRWNSPRSPGAPGAGRKKTAPPPARPRRRRRAGAGT